jgi:hypothetical protein
LDRATHVGQPLRYVSYNMSNSVLAIHPPSFNDRASLCNFTRSFRRKRVETLQLAPRNFIRGRYHRR